MSKRAEYIAAMKRQLDELNVKLATLEATANEVKADARATYDEDVVRLRRQSLLAVTKYEHLKASTEASWDSMVTEMEKVRDAFKHSFSYFKSQI